MSHFNHTNVSQPPLGTLHFAHCSLWFQSERHIYLTFPFSFCIFHVPFIFGHWVPFFPLLPCLANLASFSYHLIMYNQKEDLSMWEEQVVNSVTFSLPCFTLFLPFFSSHIFFPPAISFLFWGFFSRWVSTRSLARKQNGLNKERTIAPHHRHTTTRPRRNILTICFVFLSLEVVTGACHHLLWWEYHNIVEPSLLHSFNPQAYVCSDSLINLLYLSTLSFNAKLGYVLHIHIM